MKRILPLIIVSLLTACAATKQSADVQMHSSDFSDAAPIERQDMNPDKVVFPVAFYGSEVGMKDATRARLAPNTVTVYHNEKKGVEFGIPFNTDWGSDSTTLTVHIPAPSGIIFGPLELCANNTPCRLQSVSFLPVKTATNTMKDLKSFASKATNDQNKPKSVKYLKINKLSVVEYEVMQSQTFVHAIVFGRKGNYDLAVPKTLSFGGDPYVYLKSLIDSAKVF